MKIGVNQRKAHSMLEQEAHWRDVRNCKIRSKIFGKDNCKVTVVKFGSQKPITQTSNSKQTSFATEVTLVGK